MRKLLSCSIVMALLFVAGPQHVAAQNGGGFGAVMDWIQRLSGPEFRGGALSIFTPDIGSRGTPRDGEESSRIFRLRLNGAYHHSADSDDVIDPDGSAITMLTIQPMLEIPIWPVRPQSWYFELGIGYAWHRFAGEVDPFWNESIPLKVQFVRELWNLENRLDVRIGVGGHYWMKFDDSDFAPLVVTLERNKREFTAAAFVALDWHVLPGW